MTGSSAKAGVRTGSAPRWPAYYTSLGPFQLVFREGLPILTYHTVGPRPRGVRMKGLYVSARLFDRQLGELRRAGYAAPCYDLAANPAAGNGRQVLLTFDDGVRKAAACALPILERHGFWAIQFLVASRIGGTNTWQTAEGEAGESLMDEGEIREWLAAGHLIGAHTLTHPWLTRIAPAEAREEITASKKVLEDRFGVRVDHFCYPYGDHDAAVMDLVGEAGYRTACTVESGVNRSDTPRLALRRFTARYRSRSLRSVKDWWRRWRGRGSVLTC